MSTRAQAPTIKSLTNKVKELEDANYRLVGLNAKLRWPEKTPLTAFRVGYSTQAKILRQIELPKTTKSLAFDVLTGTQGITHVATTEDEVEITHTFLVLAATPGEAINAGYGEFIKHATDKMNALNVRPNGTSTIRATVSEVEHFIGEAQDDGHLEPASRRVYPAGL